MQEKDNTNYGILILKIWMCFEVICCHFWNGSDGIVLSFLDNARDLAVPCFMFVSFLFLGYSINITDDYHKFVKNRIVRILWPHISWSLILWILINILNILTKKETLPLISVFVQLVTGHSYNTPMWFQVILLILTIFVLSIYFLLDNYKNTFMIITIMASLGAIILEHCCCLNGVIDLLRFEIRYPVGRFIEMIPYAFIGFWLGKTAVLDRVNILLVSVLSVFVVIVSFGVKLWDVMKPIGYNYQGIGLFVTSLGLCIMFYIMPLDRLPKWIKTVIIKMSKYTLGIYCIHIFVGESVEVFLTKFGCELRTILECFLIFSVCYLLCWGVGKVPNKLIKKLVS